VIALASVFTAVAVLMSAAAALQRAAGVLELTIMVIVSVSVVLAVHLIPAVLREHKKWVVWPVWVLAFLCALWGHITFFSSAADSAARTRFAKSGAPAALAQKRASLEAELDAIKARPLAVIARQLAWSKNEDTQAALRIEMREAERAVRLREMLLELDGSHVKSNVESNESHGNSHVTSHASHAVTLQSHAVTFDPGTRALADMIGVPAERVVLAVSIISAMLVELVGMLLWCSALRPARVSQKISPKIPEAEPQIAHETEHETVSHPPQISEPAPSAVAQQILGVATPPADELQVIRQAVADGRCRATVQSIRAYAGCGQARAAELRKLLKT